MTFLVYAFPPCPAIGSVRAANMAKSLATLGWKVNVVTPSCQHWGWEDSEPIPGVEEIRVDGGWSFLGQGSAYARRGLPQRLISGIANRWMRGVRRLETESFWAKPATRAILSSSQKPDILLTTMSPFFTGGAIADLARKLEVPFALDYRDLVVGNAHGSFLAKNDRFVERESRWLEAANIVTTVSPTLTSILRKRVSLPEKCQTLFNGFDNDQFELVEKPERKNQPLRIVYAGTFYPPVRVIDPVFEALANLDKQGPAANWSFDYFGNWHEEVQEKARQFGISAHVKVSPQIPRGAALKEMANADLLVVITSVMTESTPEIRGVVTAKLFDCLGLRKPILLISPGDSDAAQVVRETGGGFVCAGDQIKEIQSAMENVAAGNSPIPRAEKFSWSCLGQRLDKLLKNAIGN